MKMNAIGYAMAHSVAPSDFERCGGDVGGEDFGARQFMRQSNRKAARSGTYIGPAQGRVWFVAAARAQAFERHFHHVLGLRPRNQHRGRDFELESPEFLLPGKVLRRLTCGAARDK